MNPFKTFLYAFIFALSGNSVLAQQSLLSNNFQNLEQPSLSESIVAYSNAPESFNPYYKLTLTDSTAVQLNTYPPTKRDWKRLGLGSSMYVGAAVISFGILWALPESVSNWDKEEIKEKGIIWKWKENVKAGPVWDEDDWVLNWITHPYSGGVYYMTARSSGFTWYESFLYSALMSTCFWEYGIEAFAEIPSKQDLIITPVVGSMVGEGFFYAKKKILKNDRKVLKSRFLGYTSLFLMDPFNTLLDSFGYEDKRVNTHMGFAPIDFDRGSNKAIWGVNFNVRF